tara:strand:- start:581 stop:808 length:228 start_codon:yes stop_codon:yes gene_type:complete
LFKNAKKKIFETFPGFLDLDKNKCPFSDFSKYFSKKSFFFFKKMGLHDNGLISILKQEKNESINFFINFFLKKQL